MANEEGENNEKVVEAVIEEENPVAEELRFIADIPMTVSVEFGRTTIPVRRFLELKAKSVVPLDKLAGEPIEVLLNGKKIARGEALIVNERYGVRLTDIITPADYIKNKD